MIRRPVKTRRSITILQDDLYKNHSNDFSVANKNLSVLNFHNLSLYFKLMPIFILFFKTSEMIMRI